MYNENMHIL